MGEYFMYGAIALIGVMVVLIAFCMANKKENESKLAPAPLLPVLAPVDIVTASPEEREDKECSIYRTPSGALPMIYTSQGATTQDVDARGKWTVQDYKDRVGPCRTYIETRLVYQARECAKAVSGLVSLASALVDPKLSTKTMEITSALYEPTGAVRTYVESPYAFSHRQMTSGDSLCNNSYAYENHITLTATALGPKGIYRQSRTTAINRLVPVRVLIDDDIADEIFKLIDSDNNRTRVPEDFSTGYDCLLKTPYLQMMACQDQEREPSDVKLIWPMRNLSDKVLQAFKDLHAKYPNAVLSVVTYGGHSHVCLDGGPEAMVFTDRSSYFNMVTREHSDTDHPGKQLLDQFGDEITEPTWKTIEPYEDRIIRWFIDPTLHEKVEHVPTNYAY